MVSIQVEKLKQQIKEHEGYRLDVYVDTLGFDTGGYGHKILPGEVPPTTKEGWDKIFDEDFDKAWNLTEKFCEDNELSIPLDVQCILCEMIYQMGFAGVSKFKMMITALKEKDFKEAAKQMLDSRWAKQTPSRANQLSQQMESIQEET